MPSPPPPPEAPLENPEDPPDPPPEKKSEDDDGDVGGAVKRDAVPAELSRPDRPAIPEAMEAAEPDPYQ